MVGPTRHINLLIVEPTRHISLSKVGPTRHICKWMGRTTPISVLIPLLIFLINDYWWEYLPIQPFLIFVMDEFIIYNPVAWNSLACSLFKLVIADCFNKGTEYVDDKKTTVTQELILFVLLIYIFVKKSIVTSLQIYRGKHFTTIISVKISFFINHEQYVGSSISL